MRWMNVRYPILKNNNRSQRNTSAAHKRGTGKCVLADVPNYNSYNPTPLAMMGGTDGGCWPKHLEDFLTPIIKPLKSLTTAQASLQPSFTCHLRHIRLQLPSSSICQLGMIEAIFQWLQGIPGWGRLAGRKETRSPFRKANSFISSPLPRSVVLNEQDIQLFESCFQQKHNIYMGEEGENISMTQIPGLFSLNSIKLRLLGLRAKGFTGLKNNARHCWYSYISIFLWYFPVKTTLAWFF